MMRWDLFVLSWESLRRVEWGKVSFFLSMSGGGLFNVWSVYCRSSELWSLRCFSIGRIFVSSCM